MGEYIMNQVNPLGLEKNEYQVAIKKKGASKLDNTIEKIDNIFDKMSESEQKELLNALGNNADGAIDSYKSTNKKLAKRLEDYKEYCEKHNVDASKKNNIWANLITTLVNMNKKEEKLYTQVGYSDKEEAYVKTINEQITLLNNQLKAETNAEKKKEIAVKISNYNDALSKLAQKYGVERPTDGKLAQYALSITTLTDRDDIEKYIKEQLKAQNFYNGQVEDYIKSNEFKDLMQKVADRNAMKQQIEKGYVGVKKSTVEHLKGQNTAELTNWAASGSGAEIAMNKQGAEDEVAARAANTESSFDNTIQNKTLEDVLTYDYNDNDETTPITDGFTVKQHYDKDGNLTDKDMLYNGNEIANVTLKSGQVVQGYNNYKDIKLSDILDIEVASDNGNNLEVTSNGKNAGITEKDMRRLYKGNGGRVIDEKKNEIMKNAVAALATGIAGAVAPFIYKHTTNVTSFFSHTIQGDASWTSDLLKQIEEQLNAGLTDKNVQVALKEFEGGYTYEKLQKIQTNHYCTRAVLLTGLTAIAGDMLQTMTANTQERAVNEDKYIKLAKMFTDATIQNAKGGDGYIMNEHEYNVLLAENKALIHDLIPIAEDLIRAIGKQKIDEKQYSTPEVATTPVKETPEKVARIKTINKPEQCQPYKPISGEHWTSITALGFVDNNGNPITGKDIYEVARTLKRRNGYQPDDKTMPRIVYINPENPDDNTIKTKSGKVYTWNYCEEDLTDEEDKKAMIDKRKAMIDKYTNKKAQVPDEAKKYGNVRVKANNDAQTRFVAALAYDTKNTVDESDDVLLGSKHKTNVPEKDAQGVLETLVDNLKKAHDEFKKWLDD